MEDEPTEKLLNASRFWIQRVFVPILVCIGVSGNVVTVMVLTRKRMRCSTNIYLTALAIADIIYLLFVFTLSFSHYDNIHNIKYELYWRFYGLAHWICDAASSTSVWLTVSFTLERYIAVCHPIKGKILCTENRAKSIIVIIVFFCILTTASTTFEYQLDLNETCTVNKTCIDELNNPQQSIKLLRTEQFYTGNTDKHDNTINQNVVHNSININNNNNNNDNDSTSSSDQETTRIINELIKKLEPKIRSLLLPMNCTQHPHIIYIPIYTLSSPSSSSTSSSSTSNQISTKTNTNSISINYKNYSVGVVIDNDLNNYYNNKSEPVNSRQEQKLLQTIQSDSLQDYNSSNASSYQVNISSPCCILHRKVGTEQTNLAKNETYKLIIQWYSALCFYLIPLVFIATFNSFLVHSVYKSQKTRRTMTYNSPERMSMSNENRITIMLICVVILFLICQTPTASILIFNNFVPESDDVRTENIKKILGNIFNFLVTVNAACNFILYCVLSKKFRTTFKLFFFDRNKKKAQSTDTLLLATSRTRCTNGFDKRRTTSEIRTPRNLETQSLTSIPRSKSLMMRPPGKARSSDLNL